MLRSIKKLYGEKLRASDGEIGHVKDFYFNYQKWVVRYVVVDTGSWLLGRLVLIAPYAFGRLDQDRAFLQVVVNTITKVAQNSIKPTGSFVCRINWLTKILKPHR